MMTLGALGLSFQTALWWGWVLLAVALSAGVLAWLYRRLFQLYPRRQALTVLGLKIAAVTVLLLGLLRPALYKEEKDLANARVVLLVDNSRSMSTRDGSIGQPRNEEARQLVFDKIMPRLKGRLLVTPLEFSDSVKSLEKPEQLTATGEGSDIVHALLEGPASRPAGTEAGPTSGSVGAFLLVSDGGDARVLPPAFSAGAPVFALAVGTDLANANDLRIGEIEYPERVDSKTDFDVKVEVAAGGRPEFFDALKSVSLTLTESGKNVKTEAVNLTAAARRQNLILRVSAAEPGIRRYTLKLPVLKSEVAELNNERTFTVEVQDPSLRVFYYATQLGQGYKALRNAIKSDPGIHITGLLRLGGDRFLLQGEKPGDDIKNEFPTAAVVLKKFKCIVVADCEAKDISPAAQKALEQFVADGGALVLLGGPRGFGAGGWALSNLAPAFPWQIAAGEPAYKNESVAVELSPLGRAHPIFRGLSEALSGGGPVAKMNGYNSPGSPRPGAQGLVLAVLPSSEHPVVLALSRYGKGKVLGIASHGLWLWSDAEAEGGKAYSAFWRQAVRFLAGSEDGGGLLKLTADRQGRYTPGSKAIVTANVLDRSLQPLKGATLSAALKRMEEDGSTGVPAGEGRAPTGTEAGPTTFREDGPPGAYSADVDLAAAGSYRLQVSASDSKGLLETREILLEAGAGTGEGAFPAVNTAYLQELAAKSGGAMLPQNRADELLDKILDGVKAEVRRKEISLVWDSPFYFLLFLGLMTCEWVARRRMNMI